jgi:hypothetical protein
MFSERGWLAVCGAAIVLCGCPAEQQKAQPKTGTGSSVTAEDRSRCNASGKRVVTLDLNQDKQPDVWKIYAAKTEGGSKVEVLTCKEQDLNYDGRKDIWIYYDDTGNRQMEEMDLDFDGKVDLITIRRGGKVVRQELDTNYDGKPDIWKHFVDEVLERVERDSNYDGRVDYWEYYEGGQLDRVGYDKDGDGKPEELDRAPAQATAAAPPPAKKEEKAPQKKKEEKE